MAPNGSKWLQKALKGSKWLQIAPNGSKWLQMAPNGSEWLQMAQDGSKWLQISPNGSKFLQTGLQLHKASILCILDTRQIDPHKTARLQNDDNTSWGKGPACIT